MRKTKTKTSILKFQLDEENFQFPFAISNVMSLASDQEQPLTPQPQQHLSLTISPTTTTRVLKSPPPLSPLGSAPLDRTKVTPITKKATTHRVVLKDIPMHRVLGRQKSPAAMAVMMKKLHSLYKCPDYTCTYSTNTRTLFQEHLRTHPSYLTRNARIPCVYCNYGNSFDHVLIHVDARHGKCAYCCSLCFYRGLTQAHVKYHLIGKHSNASNGVAVQVQLNPQAQNVKVPVVLPPLKTLFKGLLLECPEPGKSTDYCYLYFN